MNIEVATSDYVFDYPFDIGVRNFLSEKRKKYLHDLLEK